MNRRFWFGLLIVLSVLPAACASVPKDPQARAVYERNNDPLEPLNRQIFAFNLRADQYVMRPVTKAYRAVTTPDFRKGVRTFFANLHTPVTVVNDILQLNLPEAGKELSRFTINSTLGFFGIFDVADRLGIAPQAQSFGNTLGVWGSPPGPFLMLPLLGPSDVRDLIGMGADIAFDPLTYAAVTHDRRTMASILVSMDILEALAKYENSLDLLDDARKNSLDYYAYTRSMYQQYRRAAVDEAAGRKNSEGQKASYEFSLDDFDDENTE